MICTHCGFPIQQIPEGPGFVWVHDNGFALCHVSDPESTTWAEPKKEGQ